MTLASQASQRRALGACSHREPSTIRGGSLAWATSRLLLASPAMPFSDPLLPFGRSGVPSGSFALSLGISGLPLEKGKGCLLWGMGLLTWMQKIMKIYTHTHNLSGKSVLCELCPCHQTFAAVPHQSHQNKSLLFTGHGMHFKAHTRTQ